MKINTMLLPINRNTAYPPVTNELLDSIVAKIKATGRPLKIVFFGSRARGDHKPDSDLDLMIIEVPDIDCKEQLRKYKEALGDFYPESTILVKSLFEVEQWKYVPNYITSEALSQGTVLYEDPQRFAQLTQQVAKLFVSEAEPPEYKTVNNIACDWFKKGNKDIKAAEILLEQDGPIESVCFHAQQAAEKYLKGYLAWKRKNSEKTHILEHLVKEVLEIKPIAGLKELRLEILTAYAIKARYDADFDPAVEVAESALECAIKLRELILAQVPLEARPD